MFTPMTKNFYFIKRVGRTSKKEHFFYHNNNKWTQNFSNARIYKRLNDAVLSLKYNNFENDLLNESVIYKIIKMTVPYNSDCASFVTIKVFMVFEKTDNYGDIIELEFISNGTKDKINIGKEFITL